MRQAAGQQALPKQYLSTQVYRLLVATFTRVLVWESIGMRCIRRDVRDQMGADVCQMHYSRPCGYITTWLLM